MKKLTVFIASLALVATFAMSAAAAEWNFYGSARVATFSIDIDPDVAGTDSDRDTQWAVQGNSRIGAKVKVSDTLSGRFEYGTGINLRLLYGTWNFGAGSLTAGQFYSPMNFFLSNQVFGGDAGMLNTGGLYSGRLQGLQLKFGAFKVALLSPGTMNTTPAGDIDTTLPKIEMSYHLALGKAFVDFAAGYNSYDVELGANDYDVDSFVVGVAFGINLGTFYVKSNAWIGENVGPYGIWHDTADNPVYVAGTNRVVDNDSYGLLLVVGAKISDMISIEGGIGYTESELDVSGAQEDDEMAYYIQATVNLAPGVFIVPEIGRIDYKDIAGVEEGDLTYFGIKWQINF